MNDMACALVNRIKQSRGRDASAWLAIGEELRYPRAASLLATFARRRADLSAFATGDVPAVLDVLEDLTFGFHDSDGWIWDDLVAVVERFERLGAEATGRMLAVVLPRLVRRAMR